LIKICKQSKQFELILVSFASEVCN